MIFGLGEFGIFSFGRVCLCDTHSDLLHDV